jgi:hypothetical protein
VGDLRLGEGIGFFAFGDLLSLTAKESRQRNPLLRRAFHWLQCFCELKPPSPARAVPTPPGGVFTFLRELLEIVKR